MGIDVERQFEADLRRRLDECLDDDARQADPSARFLIARNQPRRMMSLPG